MWASRNGDISVLPPASEDGDRAISILSIVNTTTTSANRLLLMLSVRRLPIVVRGAHALLRSGLWKGRSFTVCIVLEGGC